MRLFKKSFLFALTAAIVMVVLGQADAHLSATAEQHIKQRHWYNAKSGPNTSRFNRSMTVQKLDAIAQKTIQQGSKRKSTHGQGRHTHQYKFKKPIGVSGSGKKSYTLRVVTDSKKNVITAFPI